MNPIAARARQLLLACTLLGANVLASPAALAQARDEAWVIDQITAGRFEELRPLGQLSDQGVPFAMYWWGLLLERCILGRCDQDAGRELIRRAAVAGHSRAKMRAIADVDSSEALEELLGRIGVPAAGRERIVYVSMGLLLLDADYLVGRLGGGPPKAADAKAADAKRRADLLAIAASEPQIGMRVIAATAQGPGSSQLDALAETGIELLSEQHMQRLLIKRISEAPILERARAGQQLGLAAAYCDTFMIRTGRTTMERLELEACEKAAAAGFPAAVRGLLTYHQQAGNAPAAEYFAGLCDALLGSRCAGALADYYGERSEESAEMKARWELWDLAAANVMTAASFFSGGVSEEELRGKTPRLRRELLQLVVRSELIADACYTQTVDAATGALAADPRCPWLKPIAIPAQFLGK
jgi:hypothetical protein